MSIGIFSCIIYEMEGQRKKKTPQKKIDEIARKKQEFKKYYRQLPIIKLCAGKIGVHRDTVYKWLDSDSAFYTQLEELKYEFAMENLPQVKNREWVLERILREHFTPRTEITGKDGKDLPSPITIIDNVSGNNSVKKIEEPTEEN